MKVDKISYLENKLKREQEFSEIQRKDYCYKCMKPKKVCLCKNVVSFHTNVKIVLLIHPMEAKKEKMGTGRLSHLYLQNSQMIMGVDFTKDAEVNAFIQDSSNACYLVYPGSEAIMLSGVSQNFNGSKLERDIASKKNIIAFLIDGTWPCAKKMMKLSTNLHHLPRLSFEVTKKSMFAIKEQPGDFCLSTIESIHLMLSLLEANGVEKLQGKHDKMLESFQEMIDFQIKCATDPSLPSYKNHKKGYKKPEDRVRSKKWEQRKIIF